MNVPGTARRATDRAFQAFVLAFLGYAALTLLLFHDLAGRFSTAVPHDLGDPLLSTWILWWNAHQLPFTAAWWDGLSFFPGHGSLARIAMALAGDPLRLPCDRKYRCAVERASQPGGALDDLTQGLPQQRVIVGDHQPDVTFHVSRSSP